MKDFFSTELFHEVQMQQVFKDGKTFVDCMPLLPLQEINNMFIANRNEADFSLQHFIHSHFQIPIANNTGHESDMNKPVAENIEKLWPVLTRNPDKTNGSIIPLPLPYIVPGGRFGEIYYWDSYFTMLGLKVSGKYDMIENMVNNFSYLIDTLGYIPNGNRQYFIGRSQPPFYSLMVKMLADIYGENILLKYLPQLEKEYNFWMKGSDTLHDNNTATHHSVKLNTDIILNRYWDENDTPRPESYREDIELSHKSKQDAATLFRHLRAGAESGWDYSCRWFANINDFATIHTADIIPVDLNCLLFHLEEILSQAYALKNDSEQSAHYSSLSIKRKNAIQQYCWNEELGFYFDYDFIKGEQKTQYTLTGVFPLFFKISTQQQSSQIKKVIEEKFLQKGGLISTLYETGQQWDAPNGWAPLQYIAITGLEQYGHTSLAKDIAQRWIQLNTDVFKRTGKLMEKYNVINTELEAGGGEYESQDGFGWTNGVLLALMERYG